MILPKPMQVVVDAENLRKYRDDEKFMAYASESSAPMGCKVFIIVVDMSGIYELEEGRGILFFDQQSFWDIHLT